MSNSVIEAGPSAASDAEIAEPTPPVPTTRHDDPAISNPLRITPRTKPAPSNMSPASVPSGFISSALQAPAILTAVLGSSSNATVVTLCGMVISAPWMLVNLRITASAAA